MRIQYISLSLFVSVCCQVNNKKDKIIFTFGDSLTNTGNINTKPSSQSSIAFWNGRYSNGPVWTEYLAYDLNARIVDFSYANTKQFDSTIRSKSLLEQIKTFEQYYNTLPEAEKRSDGKDMIAVIGVDIADYFNFNFVFEKYPFSRNDFKEYGFANSTKNPERDYQSLKSSRERLAEYYERFHNFYEYVYTFQNTNVKKLVILNYPNHLNHPFLLKSMQSSRIKAFSERFEENVEYINGRLEFMIQEKFSHFSTDYKINDDKYIKIEILDLYKLTDYVSSLGFRALAEHFVTNWKREKKDRQHENPQSEASGTYTTKDAMRPKKDQEIKKDASFRDRDIAFADRYHFSTLTHRFIGAVAKLLVEGKRFKYTGEELLDVGEKCFQDYMKNIDQKNLNSLTVKELPVTITRVK